MNYLHFQSVVSDKSYSLLDVDELVVSVDDFELPLASITPSGIPMHAKKATVIIVLRTIQVALILDPAIKSLSFVYFPKNKIF